MKIINRVFAVVLLFMVACVPSNRPGPILRDGQGCVPLGNAPLTNNFSFFNFANSSLQVNLNENINNVQDSTIFALACPSSVISDSALATYYQAAALAKKNPPQIAAHDIFLVPYRLDITRALSATITINSCAYMSISPPAALDFLVMPALPDGSPDYASITKLGTIDTQDQNCRKGTINASAKSYYLAFIAFYERI